MTQRADATKVRGLWPLGDQEIVVCSFVAGAVVTSMLGLVCYLTISDAHRSFIVLVILAASLLALLPLTMIALKVFANGAALAAVQRSSGIAAEQAAAAGAATVATQAAAVAAKVAAEQAVSHAASAASYAHEVKVQMIAVQEEFQVIMAASATTKPKRRAK